MAVRRLLAALVVAAVVAVAAWRILSHEPGLLASASRVIDATGWSEALGITDDQLLVFRETDPIRNLYTISRFDMTTGGEMPLPVLARLFNVHQGYAHASAVSPDGKWLLWPTADSHMAATLDGQHVREWPKPPADRQRYTHTGDIYGMDECWLADSRHWVQLDGSAFTHVTIHSVDDPALSRVVGVPPDISARLDGDDQDAAEPVDGARLRFTDWQKSIRGDPAGIVDVDLSGPRATMVRDYGIPLLPPDVRLKWSFAPFGNRVAWLAWRHIPSWLPRPLRRFFPSLAQPQERISVWIRAFPGGTNREVGAMDVDGPLVDAKLPCDLRWLPSGRAVRFAYRGRLYIVPVP